MLEFLYSRVKEAREALEANEAFMSIYKQIFEDAKGAMLKKEGMKLTVLKGVKAAFTNELLAKKGPVNQELSDDDALAVIRRLVKQRKDSIDLFTKGGRKDLADVEASELKILEVYLPAQMDDAEIEKIAKKKKVELKVTDKTKAGMLMSAIMKDLKGKADGGAVKKIVDELLS